MGWQGTGDTFKVSRFGSVLGKGRAVEVEFLILGTQGLQEVQFTDLKFIAVASHYNKPGRRVDNSFFFFFL
jgi:hypothetical protein